MAEVSLALYNLIHSLSGAEKKQFYHYASKHIIGNEENSYMLLFENIAKAKLYDEEKIKKELSGKIKNFASTKNYLYELIVKSLKSLPPINNKIEEAQDLLDTIKILEQKSQYEKCLQLIDKLKQLCYTYELYDKLQVCLNYNLRTIFHISDYSPSNFHSTLNELKTVQNLNSLCEQSELLGYQMVHLTNLSHPNKKESLKDASKIITQAFELLKNEILPHKAKFILFETIAVVNGWIGNIAEAIKYYESTILLFNEQNKMLEEYKTFYAKYCNAYLQLCSYYSHTKKLETAKSMLHNLDSILNEDKLGVRAGVVKAKLFYTEILYMLNSNNYGEFKLDRIEKFLKKFPYLNKYAYVSLCTQFSLLLLFKKELQQLSKFIAEASVNIKPKQSDIRSHKFFTIKFLLYYEREEYDLAKSCYLTELKPFVSKELEYSFEKEFYTILLDLLKNNTNRIEKLNKVKQLLHHNKNSPLIESLYLLKWIDNKL